MNAERLITTLVYLPGTFRPPMKLAFGLHPPAWVEKARRPAAVALNSLLPGVYALRASSLAHRPTCQSIVPILSARRLRAGGHF